MFIYLPIRYKRYIKDMVRTAGIDTHGCRVICFNDRVTLRFNNRSIYVGKLTVDGFKLMIMGYDTRNSGVPFTSYFKPEIDNWNRMIAKSKPALKLINKL